MEFLNKWLKRLTFGFFIVLITFLNIGTTLIAMNYFDYLDFSNGLFGIGIGALILYALYKIMNKEKIKLKDVLILILLIFGVLSYLFAFNKEEALYGVVSRNEGLRTLLAYYMIYLLSTTLDKQKQKRIMYFILGFGIYQVILGLFQTLQITNVLGYDRSMNWSTHFKFASGTLGNPNFYSIYILICLIYSWCLVLSVKSKKKVFMVILFLIFALGLIIGNTMSCILASIICIILISIKKVNKKNLKKVGIGVISSLLILSIIFITIDNTTNKRVSSTMLQNYNEIKSVFTKGINKHTGNNRIYVWKEALKKLPKYYLTGIGIDNFKYLNDGDFICANKPIYQCFDKAHNEYVQILITEGVGAFITYIAFMSFVFIKHIKSSEKEDIYKKAFKWCIIAYLIQAFFNISIICITPIFYMLLGFLYPSIKAGDNSENN